MSLWEADSRTMVCVVVLVLVLVLGPRTTAVVDVTASGIQRNVHLVSALDEVHYMAEARVMTPEIEKTCLVAWAWLPVDVVVVGMVMMVLPWAESQRCSILLQP